MTATTRAHPWPDLTTLSGPALTHHLDALCEEVARRIEVADAPLPAAEAIQRSLGVLGRSLGASYARTWRPPVAPHRPGRRCALSTAASAPTPAPSRVPTPAPTPVLTPPSERLLPITMHGVHEDRPGRAWQELFRRTWPAYRAWFAAEGPAARPDLAACRTALGRHMPELLPTWEHLVDLAGRDDEAARMLSLWNPPAFAPGCSQLVLNEPSRLLVRNYDYDPRLFEYVVRSSRFTSRRVVGTSDCLWGLLDGMNDDGLVVSLTFGGRPGTGDGFAVPLVVRYLLEVCASVAEAVAVLQRLPVAASYNLTLSDRSGTTLTAFVAPGQQPELFDAPLATNHRGLVPDHPELARRLNSVGRQDLLRSLVRSGIGAEQAAEAFLARPLHTGNYSAGFGTLYTAVYRPDEGVVEYRWPDARWRRGFDSPDEAFDVVLREPVGA